MDCIHHNGAGCTYNNIRSSRCVGGECQFYTPPPVPPKPTLWETVKGWFK